MQHKNDLLSEQKSLAIAENREKILELSEQKSLAIAENREKILELKLAEAERKLALATGDQALSEENES